MFLSSHGHDLAARDEFMRKSEMGVVPREVNYSTSKKAGGRSATLGEGIRTIVVDENHPGPIRPDSTMTRRELSAGENPARGKATKNSRPTTFLAVKANALGQFANQGAKRHECNREKLLGISNDDDTTARETRRAKTAPSALLMFSPPRTYLL